MNYTGKRVSEAINSFYEYWTIDEAEKVIALCLNNPVNISMKEFFEYCTACGGNWGAMLLSGIKRLRPKIYEAIPNRIAPSGEEAFMLICNVMYLLRIGDEE